MSDWGRVPPTTVDIGKIISKRSDHFQCGLCVHTSKKNPMFVGLYCKEHDFWLTWLNEYQCEFLNQLGVYVHPSFLPTMPYNEYLEKHC